MVSIYTLEHNETLWLYQVCDTLGLL